MKFRYIFLLILSAVALFVTSSAQQYLYYYNMGEVVRKDTVSKIDSITCEKKTIKTYIGENAVYEPKAYGVDSISFDPALSVSNVLVFSSVKEEPRGIDFKSSPEGDVAYDDVAWSCSDESIAELKDGMVYPKGEGSCFIDGVYGNRRLRCYVHVAGNDVVAGHPYVDLGLPSGTLWAIYNVGSSAAEDGGSFFTWGEVDSVDIHATGHESRWIDMTCSQLMEDGIVDSLGNLISIYDAATANWGENWKMPTENNFIELYSYCYVYREMLNGQNGVLYVSRLNGNVLFIPAAGASTGTGILYNGFDYWTSTARNESYFSASFWDFQNVPYPVRSARSLGKTLRAVVRNSLAVDTVISFAKTEFCINNSSPLTIDFLSIPTGSVSSSNVEWYSSDESVATVENGIVYPKSLGVSEISCAFKDKKIKCNVIVKKNELSENHEYVDLGLPSGTLWATCNLGASAPEDYGDYYSWGEISPKISYNELNSNAQGLDSLTLAQKGIRNGSNRVTDKFDAAIANWSEDWRLPGNAQVKELFLSCDVEVVEQNGVNGYKFTSQKNGNSIFVPSAGRTDGTDVLDRVDGFYYWTANSKMSGTYNPVGYIWGGKEKNRPDIPAIYKTAEMSVYLGMPIRPVRKLDVDIAMVDESLTLIITDRPKPVKMSFTPEMIALGDLEWSSSDESIATVHCGYVSPVSSGVCVVTGRYRDQVVSCEVKVLDVSFVDMGLPSGTLWASNNIGSEKVENVGDFYGWGDTTVAGVKHRWDGYSRANLLEEGVIDENKQLVDKYDPARIILGPSWKLPTEQQAQELVDNCTVVKDEIDGVDIIKLISKINGNSMWFAFTSTNNYTTDIWTSTLDPIFDSGLYLSCLHLDYLDKKARVYGNEANKRLPYRPVFVGDLDSSLVLSASNTDLTMTITDKPVVLGFSTIPENALNISDIEWTSTNKEVAIVKDGEVSPVAVGECVIKGFYKGQIVKYNVKVVAE